MHARLHFTRRLVGKRYRGDVARAKPAAADQMRDLFGNHPGFTGTGAGQYQQRCLSMPDGGKLGGIEGRQGGRRSVQRGGGF